jgi:Protein of unknown function (DUF2845)
MGRIFRWNRPVRMIKMGHCVEGNMISKTSSVLGCIIVLLGIMTATGPAHGFRCDGKIVTEGDYAYDVLAKCGEPDYVDTWEEERMRRGFHGPLEPQKKTDQEPYRRPALVKEQVIVEVWTYNLGRQRLTRYLRFENGRLVEITTGDYGY